MATTSPTRRTRTLPDPVLEKHRFHIFAKSAASFERTQGHPGPTGSVVPHVVRISGHASGAIWNARHCARETWRHRRLHHVVDHAHSATRGHVRVSGGLGERQYRRDARVGAVEHPTPFIAGTGPERVR